jgi:hypothetical protein
MKKRFRILALILALILLAALGSSNRVLGADPGIPDTVYVDSVTAFAVGSGVIPVYFVNDEDLFRVEVTLEMLTTEVKIDSFSFAGGRITPGPNVILNTKVFDDSTSATAGALLQAGAVPPGNGLFGTMFVSYPPSIVPKVIVIDSTTITLPNQIEFSNLFSNDSAGSSEFTPQFRKGYLDIQESPPQFDSIWISDVVTAPGSDVTVDVHLYNEKDIDSVSVALTYGSDYLIYQSVTYENTRAAGAASLAQHSSITNKLLIELDFTSSPLNPGTGVLAHIHFKVADDAPDTVITIDSTLYLFIQNTFINLTQGGQFIPFFSSGEVDIRVATDVGDDADDILPESYRLNQNYPNPFNPSTTIEFALPRATHVQLDLLNVLGQRVRQLVNESLTAGTHRVTLDIRDGQGESLATGVYFYRLKTEEFTDTRKMILLK